MTTSGDYQRVYAEAVAYAESQPERGHGAYNGWCRVAGIPLKAKDCPLCITRTPCPSPYCSHGADIGGGTDERCNVCNGTGFVPTSSARRPGDG